RRPSTSRFRLGHRSLFGHQYLALQSVGVAEEQAERRTEVVDGAVAGAGIDKSLTDDLERFAGCRLQTEVVDAAAAPHRCLALGFRVAFDGENVELGVWADPDDGHGLARLLTVRTGGSRFGVEHGGVERFQRSGVF